MNWFGKAGMGMHVACVILKDSKKIYLQEHHYEKRTYVIYWKSHQDQDTADNYPVCSSTTEVRFSRY